MAVNEPASTNGGAFVFKEAYLADWVLPSEEAPFHLLWEPLEALKTVEFRLPPGAEIRRIYNAKVTKQEAQPNGGTNYRVLDVGIHGYLSGTIQCTRLPVEREETVSIEAGFLVNGTEIHTVRFSTRVIRPTIEFVEAPNEIRIPADGKASPLDIKVRLVGSGTARVKVDVTSKGQSKVRNELLFEAILRRLSPRRHLEDSQSQLGSPKGAQVEVGEELVVQTLNRILSALEHGQDLDPEFVQAMNEQKALLGDSEYRERLGRILQSEIEQVWIASLLDMMSMNPAEGVKMQQGNTSIVIDHHFQSLEFSLTYQDAMGNNYPTLQHHIKVHDERQEGKEFEIPIRIHWMKERLEAKK